ncbi:MAG: hypothetical protein R3F40_07915 [Candidatus Competibacteraceae bacterium]
MQQTLAEQSAANQGRKAIIDALVAALITPTIGRLFKPSLAITTRGNAIYQAKYFPTLHS